MRPSWRSVHGPGVRSGPYCVSSSPPGGGAPDGGGAHATAAARLLLQSRPGFTALPAPERNELTTAIADHLESQFENRERQVPGPEIGAVLADRRQLAGFGSTTIPAASQDANEEIAHLHE